jgi:nitroreductase
MTDATLDALSPQQVEQLLISRRTVFQFDDRPVPRDLIERAIECARWAPNHDLTEPWRFHLVGSSTRRAMVQMWHDWLVERSGEEVADRKAQRWSSMPTWVIVTCERSPSDPQREQEDFASCCCAIQNFMLYMWSAKIGVQWSTAPIVREPSFVEALGRGTAEHMVVGVLFCGYPVDIPSPHRNRAWDEVIVEHG